MKIDQHITSNHTLRFPRTQREAGWAPRAEWEGKEDGSGIVSALLWALVGSVGLWVFFVLALGFAG